MKSCFRFQTSEKNSGTSEPVLWCQCYNHSRAGSIPDRPITVSYAGTKIDRILLVQLVFLLSDLDAESAGKHVDEFRAIVFVRAKAPGCSLRKFGVENVEFSASGLEGEAFEAVDDLIAAELLLERKPVLLAGNRDYVAAIGEEVFKLDVENHRDPEQGRERRKEPATLHL